MKMEIFAIRDRALEAFMRPWVAQTTGQAIRMFMDECDNPQGDISKHKSDYDLYHIGSFDDQSGAIIKPDSIKLIAAGKHYDTKGA